MFTNQGNKSLYSLNIIKVLWIALVYEVLQGNCFIPFLVPPEKLLLFRRDLVCVSSEKVVCEPFRFFWIIFPSSLHLLCHIIITCYWFCNYEFFELSNQVGFVIFCDDVQDSFIEWHLQRCKRRERGSLREHGVLQSERHTSKET